MEKLIKHRDGYTCDEDCKLNRHCLKCKKYTCCGCICISCFAKLESQGKWNEAAAKKWDRK